MADSVAEQDSHAATAVAAAATDDSLLRLGRRLPRDVFLGTSSWSFPGWQGLVYRDAHSESELARHGLPAYARHPLLRAAGLDRGFYRPLPHADYERYAGQVPAGFRLLVKAPSLFTDAVVRGQRGAPDAANPEFLNAAAAVDLFVRPALSGLGAAAGPLVFQFSPLPRPLLRGVAVSALIERIGAFLAALPREVDGHAPVYAVELRNAELLTPRLVRTLRTAGARLCLGLHARMPDAQRQSAALRALDADESEGDAWRLQGPLVVRWILHAGLSYEAAKSRYAPFDRLLDVDVFTRGALAHLIQVALRSEQPAYVIVGNKAEGSAPLTCIALAKAIVDGLPR
jgi:uncharacterized protein YecE (DUF72 family)